MRLPCAGLLAFGLCLGASSAMAQKTLVPKLDEESRRGDIARINAEKARNRFSGLDADKDDRLARAEVAENPYLTENFEKLDKDKDGFLTWEEFVGHNRWPRQAQ